MELIIIIVILFASVIIHGKMTDAEISTKDKKKYKENDDIKWIEQIFKEVEQELEHHFLSFIAYKNLGSAEGDDLEWWPEAMAGIHLQRSSMPLAPLNEKNLLRIEASLNSLASLNRSDDEIRNDSLEYKHGSLIRKARRIFLYFEENQAQVLAGLQKLEQIRIVDRRSTSTWQGDGAGRTRRQVLLPSSNERASLIELLNSNGTSCLYHFTDLSNFNSIVENGGLYSWANCEANEIKIVRPGGSTLSRELDMRRGLEHYVRLSYLRDHPMLHSAKKDGRIANPIILEIDLRVVLLHSVLFSNRNATANDAEIGPELDDLKKTRFDLIRSGRWATDDEKGLLQAEVLVIHAVPGYLIRRNGRLLRNPTDEEAASLSSLKSGIASNG